MYIFDSYTKCFSATFRTTILLVFCHWNPKWWGTPLRSVLAAHYLLILSSILKGHFYNHSLFKTVDNVCWQPDSRMNSWTWLFDIDRLGTLLVTWEIYKTIWQYKHYFYKSVILLRCNLVEINHIVIIRSNTVHAICNLLFVIIVNS